MSRTVTINNLLGETQTKPSPDLSPFIRAVLQKRGTPSLRAPKDVYWMPDYFGLDKTSLWKKLGAEQKARVLQRLNKGLLEESFYIEKSGMTYTSKMALLAETNDERSLYTMLSCDEAVHFHLIASRIQGEPSPYDEQPFLVLLNKAVLEGGYSSLIFIAQVLLEGWGLSHYHSLLKNCVCDDLSNVFRMILKDEAIHHGSGLVMTKKHPFVKDEKEMVFTIIKEFFSLVRVGPLRVASALAQEAGGLSESELIGIFNELNGPASIEENLNTLTKLVRENTPDSSLPDFIERNGLNKASSGEEFAKYLIGTLS